MPNLWNSTWNRIRCVVKVLIRWKCCPQSVFFQQKAVLLFFNFTYNCGLVVVSRLQCIANMYWWTWLHFNCQWKQPHSRWIQLHTCRSLATLCLLRPLWLPLSDFLSGPWLCWKKFQHLLKRPLFFKVTAVPGVKVTPVGVPHWCLPGRLQCACLTWGFVVCLSSRCSPWKTVCACHCCDSRNGKTVSQIPQYDN